MIGPHVLLPFLLCSLPSVQGPGSNQGKIDCLPRGIEVENLGLASPSPIFLPDAPFGRNFVVFTVSEADQGNTSSNGDSDVLDDVVHVVDTRTGQVIPLQAGVAQNVFAFRDWVVYAVSELAEGATDLDGDGDAADDVLHRFDVRSGVVANTGLPVRFTAYSSAVDERLLDGDRLLFYVSEDLADLNGDGDTADAVLHVMDVPTGVVTNLGLATADTGFGAIAHVEVDHGLALCVVDEASQGGTDLNGDGDALDLVVHLIDLETSTVTNLGLASSLYLVLGDRLGAFAVPEASQGGIDLNGDGDAVDQVLYFYDRASTQLRNSQRDLYYTVSTDGRFAAWTVSESAQGQDLDGDGMLNRSILHTYDADADLITNLQLYSANYVVKNDRLVTSAIDLEDLDADGS